MRQLNKIIFINSAHIRYAEVAMDGNVHFTGTQGVGKTTLLRALLFFYNCRKDKLGIRTQGQQTFDNFYIPDTSSYIIYEVSRGDEEPPFSIILFRHHNRAAFRFVDAPYSKDWFVDSLGMVIADHVTIRRRIQELGIDYSEIIDRYSKYLDILYGNRNAHLNKNLLKFHLLRSRQYHDISRIIQNVFLNERVDAGFIKDIIINSVTGEDEEIAVDLNFFRSKLTHFSDELKDISLWTEKKRQGIVETRRDADRLIDISHKIKAARFSLHEQCGMLCYAMNKAERDIPSLQSRIEKKETEIKDVIVRIQKLDDDYNKNRKSVEGKIAVLSNELKKAANLKKEYKRIGIEDMIARAYTLDELKLQRRQKERILEQLTSDYQSISGKYGLLRDRLNLDKEQYLHSLKEKKSDITSDFSNRQVERIKRKAGLESDIRDRFKVLSTDIDGNMLSLREQLTNMKEQRAKTAASSPRRDDLETAKRKISEAENKIHQSTEAKLKLEKQLDNLRNALELRCSQINAEAEMRIKDIDRNISQLKSLQQEELQLLDRSKDSLCEWLDNNVEGWEKTIGKIADEKSVLYSQNLCPALADGNHDTVFGISLDLNSIEKNVRTPSMIKEAADALDKEIRSLHNNIIQLREDTELRIRQICKESGGRMKTIQSEIDNLSQRIQISRTQSDEESLRLDVIKEEEKKHIEDILRSIDGEINDLQSQIESLSNERKAVDEKCEAELRSVSKAISAEEKDDKTQKDDLLQSLDNQSATYVREHNLRLTQLEKDEESALAESGADIRMLSATKEEIADISKKIDAIDGERDKIAEYRKDRRELLDLVPQKQALRKKLEEEEEGIRQKYEERGQKLNIRRQEEEKTLASLRLSCRQTTESKRQADEFIASNACPPEFKEARPVSTELDCSAIISVIKSLMLDIHNLSDRLKEQTNEFRRRFSANNTFKFPTAFDTLEDYHRYADSLEDFVSNNKIREFQQVTSNLYRDILSRAASDFNFLIGRESEIIRLVKAINHDFQKKTFAGVIRSIELRLDRSTMPIITQLQNITDFWNTHQYDLGEMNLFSSDEHTDINKESIKYLKSLATSLQTASDLNKLPLEQTFALKFRIQENDNVTDWVENIRAVGSEGTDILVKAIINILLISVFKNRAGRDGDFRLHCMMDEIGRLADENIQGILNFANQRGIYIVNSSPKAHRPLSYRRLYMLLKDNKANTIVQPILSTRESELL